MIDVFESISERARRLKSRLGEHKVDLRRLRLHVRVAPRQSANVIVAEVRGGGLGAFRAATLVPRRFGLATTLLCVIGLFTPVAARASDPDKPTFDIKFDDTALRDLITMVKAKDTSDTSIDHWLNLPANKYILSVGDSEQNLTRDQFRKNLIAEIDGTATAQSQPPTDIGSLWMSSPDDYSAMLDAFEHTADARIKTIAARLAGFSPSRAHIKETVYLHLGGDWDAVNDHNAIYVNVRFWHDLHRPGWDGINMVVAHETMHSVQNVVYGNPEDQLTSTGAFLTAMSKVQREGTARFVEYDTDPGPYTPSTYGFYYRAISTESYRAFPTDIKLMDAFYKACYPTFSQEQFMNVYAQGLGNGGPLYDVGYGIAKAIDDHLGRQALIDTVVHGPKLFYQDYMGLCASDPQLPKLPVDVEKAIDAMPDRLSPPAAALIPGPSPASLVPRWETGVQGS
jgi:hypothetical protein